MIRAFDGSLADAEGLLAVEQATFDECPYTAHQIQAMLQPGNATPIEKCHPEQCEGPESKITILSEAKDQNRHSLQCAWLAVNDNPVGTPNGNVVGFVTAFPVSSLEGIWWEIDLLAVHPDWQGRGLGRQLIRAAAAGGEGLVNRSRAVVATGNRRSTRAFTHAGFQVQPSACTLLIRRFDEQAPWPQPASGVTVHQAASPAGAAPIQNPESLCRPLLPAKTAILSEAKDQNRHLLTLLLAEDCDCPAGQVELIQVQTLLYRGIWIESLGASSRQVRETLVYHALSRAIAAGLDEVSAVVQQQNQPLLHTLLACGFRSLGTYRWLTAKLPLANP